MIEGPRKPLGIIDQPTVPPKPSEALIHVTWTSSTPLDLHRADGGLLINKYPFLMGGSFAGTVLAVGANSDPDDSNSTPQNKQAHVQVGDVVFGMTMDGVEAESTFQPYITVPLWRVSKLPPNLTPQEAVSVPTNLVTAMHTATHDLGLAMPWPVPDGWQPPAAFRTAPILVWGAASSVGLYLVQVLKHWGYAHVLAVASGRHHATLKGLGAKECFDYREGEDVVVGKIKRYLDGVAGTPKVPFIVDCIGSRDGTLRPLTQIAESGAKVAVMLPVINVHAAEDRAPEYEMDISKVLVGHWKEGVELIGTRTHFYAEVRFVWHISWISPG
jgi:NADPH:quinone reductase-like Zn-dependent oxidoreductase